MGAVMEVGYALGKKALEAEADKRIESESNKKAEVKASVLMKKFMAQQRASESHPETPAGTPSDGKGEFERLQQRLVEGEVLSPAERASYRALEKQKYP